MKEKNLKICILFTIILFCLTQVKDTCLFEICQNDIINDFMIDDIQYAFNISMTHQEFHIKIMKRFDYWENRFTFNEIHSLPQWNSFKNETNMINFISNSIYSKNILVNLGTDPTISTISFIMKFNSDGMIFNFILPLKFVKLNIPTKLEDLPYYIIELQNRFHHKLFLIEQRIQGKDQKELREENNRLKEEIIDLKLGKKIYSEFLPMDGIKFNSNNTTIIKSGGDYWRGIRCNRILYNTDRHYYTLKIVRTLHAHFMFGFCSTAIKQFGKYQNEGFHRSLETYMFYMHNGAIYESSNPIKTIAGFTKPISGDVLDIVIDFNKKTIFLYKEGKEIGFSPINLTENDLTPCIDMHNDQDSLILV